MAPTPDPAPLLERAAIGAWTLRNRVVMAPMTRSRAAAGGVVTELQARYYAQRATAGLIIAEASQISPQAQGYIHTPGIYSPAQIDSWRLVTEAVHTRGGTIVLQLWHVGRLSHPENRLPGTPSVSCSALAPAVRIVTPSGMQDVPVPHALQPDEIDGIVADYARAALNARAAGFDGVEIHAANGYLIDQFLHDSSNQRSDGYGGSAANRCRLLFEVCERTAAAVGADRVGVRLSPFGTFNDVHDRDPEALFTTAIQGLSQRGLAYLHVVNLEANGDRSTKAEVPVNVAQFARSRYRGSLIACGGYDPASAAQAVSSGVADAVAFGRSYIANPDLVARIHCGAALAVPDRRTFYTGGESGYVDYASLDLHDKESS